MRGKYDVKEGLFLCGTMLSRMRNVEYHIIDYSDFKRLKEDCKEKLNKNIANDFRSERYIKELIDFYLEEGFDVTKIDKKKYYIRREIKK